MLDVKKNLTFAHWKQLRNLEVPMTVVASISNKLTFIAAVLFQKDACRDLPVRTENFGNVDKSTTVQKGTLGSFIGYWM